MRMFDKLAAVRRVITGTNRAPAENPSSDMLKGQAGPGSVQEPARASAWTITGRSVSWEREPFESVGPPVPAARVPAPAQERWRWNCSRPFNLCRVLREGSVGHASRQVQNARREQSVPEVLGTVLQRGDPPSTLFL